MMCRRVVKRNNWNKNPQLCYDTKFRGKKWRQNFNGDIDFFRHIFCVQKLLFPKPRTSNSVFSCPRGSKKKLKEKSS